LRVKRGLSIRQDENARKTMRLKGKKAVVTGGGSGIGRAVAEGLIREGCRVVIGGRNMDKLTEVMREQKESRDAIAAHTVDVGDFKSVEDFINWAKKELGQIDLLVNAAGVNIKTRTLADMQPAQWEEVMRINANGPYYTMHCVLAEMRARKDGLIINISSTSGKRASMLGGIAYCASKFAATATMTAASLEEGKNGVRVTSIFPGEVDTPILEFRPAPVSAERKATMLKPEDVAEAVVFVASLPPRAHVPELVIKPTVQDYA
jgi:NADP-dependent 3-hydroxy acid dehydrogenase YdfG